MEMITDIAANLKNLRKVRKLSPEALAELAGLPVEVILGYEKDPETLSPEIALQLLDAMLPPDEDEQEPAGLAGPPQELLDGMESKMHEMEAALRIDEGRFQDALRGLDLALALTSQPARIGRILLSKAAVLSQVGRELKALEDLRVAASCLDAAKEPALWLRLRLEQLHAMCQLERFAEAEPWLAEATELAERVGRDWERLQVRCIRGWISAGLGRGDEAIAVFGPLRGDLKAANRIFEATAIGLDLAGLLAGKGDSQGVLALADEMEPLLGNRRIPDAAKTPLKLFCWAARRGNFRAERGSRLSLEFRKGGGRLARPYELPV